MKVTEVAIANHLQWLTKRHVSSVTSRMENPLYYIA